MLSVLIPIKDKSERIPGKNFRPFNGKPLHFWVIEKMILSHLVDRIYIDTDSNRILDYYSSNSRITLIERPMNLRGDRVSMNAIIAHDLTIIEDEHILQTHVTNPLLSLYTIDEAISKYFNVRKQKFDSLFSVTEHKKRFYTVDGKAINHDPETLINTQDLTPLLEENSCFYIFSKSSFAASKKRIGERPYMFHSSPLESIDIDYPEDFLLAESLQIVDNEKESVSK